MATARVSSRIAAPIERVFQIFTDIDHGAGHVSGIKEIERLTQGRFSLLGTRWRETREVLGIRDDAEMEVTALELNRQYTITHHKAGVRIDAVFTFEPAAGGTTVSVEFGLGAHGLPPGLLAPLEWAIAGKVRDVLTQDLVDLKKSIEKQLDAPDCCSSNGLVSAACCNGGHTYECAGPDRGPSLRSHHSS